MDLRITAAFVAFFVGGLVLLAYRRQPRRNYALEQIRELSIDNNLKLSNMPTKQEFIDRLDRIDAANAAQAQALSENAESQANIAEDIRRIKESVTGNGLPEDVEADILSRLDAAASASENSAAAIRASADSLKSLADENKADGEGDTTEPTV